MNYQQKKNFFSPLFLWLTLIGLFFPVIQSIFGSQILNYIDYKLLIIFYFVVYLDISMTFYETMAVGILYDFIFSERYMVNLTEIFLIQIICLYIAKNISTNNLGKMLLFFLVCFMVNLLSLSLIFGLDFIKFKQIIFFKSLNISFISAIFLLAIDVLFINLRFKMNKVKAV